MARQDSQGYRGRRRLPKLPSRRYAMVVLTAAAAAVVVAMVADAVVPDNLYAQSVSTGSEWFGQGDIGGLTDRTDYGDTVSVDPDAPDVWRLPLWPAEGSWRISDRVRTRGARLHYGWDLAPNGGKSVPIHAVHAGVVVDIGNEVAGFGRNVKINHGDGIIIIYAHECCWDYSTIVVHEGQQVTAGQVLANVGATGDSTGPHLHLEIRRYEVDGNGQPYWNRPYTRVLGVNDFLRSHGVDLETQQETATGGAVN